MALGAMPFGQCMRFAVYGFKRPQSGTADATRVFSYLHASRHLHRSGMCLWAILATLPWGRDHAFARRAETWARRLERVLS